VVFSEDLIGVVVHAQQYAGDMQEESLVFAGAWGRVT